MPTTTRFTKDRVVQELRKRWILFAALGVYLLVGGLFGILVYKYDWDQSATRWAARIFPLPAARVNGEMIWLSAYYRRTEVINHYAARTDEPGLLPEEQSARNAVTLDQLVDLALIRQEARKAGIKLTQEEINEHYQWIAEEAKQKQNLDPQVDAEENFQKVLENFYGITPIQFAQEFLPAELYRDKLRQQLFTQLHLRTIVVRDEGQAKDLIERLKKGEDFAELAKNFSIDLSSREQGGDFGWIQRGQLEQPLEDAFFHLEAGQFTDSPVKTEFGYHIFKVEERKEGQVTDKSFDQWFTEVKANARISRYVA